MYVCVCVCVSSLSLPLFFGLKKVSEIACTRASLSASVCVYPDDRMVHIYGYCKKFHYGFCFFSCGNRCKSFCSF